MELLKKIYQKLPFGFIEICTVWNDPKTESYSLRKDGWVVVRNPCDKGTDMIPVILCSQQLVDAFDKELSKDR